MTKLFIILFRLISITSFQQMLLSKDKLYVSGLDLDQILKMYNDNKVFKEANLAVA